MACLLLFEPIGDCEELVACCLELVVDTATLCFLLVEVLLQVSALVFRS